MTNRWKRGGCVHIQKGKKGKDEMLTLAPVRFTKPQINHPLTCLNKKSKCIISVFILSVRN